MSLASQINVGPTPSETKKSDTFARCFEGFGDVHDNFSLHLMINNDLDISLVRFNETFAALPHHHQI